jgi:uncharacterized SAM-binding protein YcdF (DUF218 family)
MIYLHKALPVLLSPIFIVLVLLGIGVVCRRRAWVLSGMCLLYVASTPLVSDALFRKIEQRVARLTPADAPQADAIVALSAGMGWVKTKTGFVAEWPTPGRFFGGIDLFQAGKAPLLVFTGGKLPWQQGDETEGEVLKKYAERMQVPSNSLLVTERVENTEQEALAAKKLLQPAVRKIILVTSAFHMPRAQHLFEQAGFEVFPYSVNIRIEAESITPMSFLPDPQSLSATGTALRELLGRLYYQLKPLNFAVAP